MSEFFDKFKEEFNKNMNSDTPPNMWWSVALYTIGAIACGWLGFQALISFIGGFGLFAMVFLACFGWATWVFGTRLYRLLQ